jgi:hypothetical protein
MAIGPLKEPNDFLNNVGHANIPVIPFGFKALRSEFDGR